MYLIPINRLRCKGNGMGNQTDYFERIGYRPKYWIGDRVFGYWNKIPFIGSVGNDTVINEIEGPRVSIHLDLPIKYNDTIHNVIIVKHKDISKLAEF
jgi:hypothetical protein